MVGAKGMDSVLAQRDVIAEVRIMADVLWKVVATNSSTNPA